MTEQTIKNIYTLLQELVSDKEQMHEYSNKRYSFCKTYARHYLIYDSKTGTMLLSTGDNPEEALYKAIDETEAEWQGLMKKSRHYTAQIYRCSNCGYDVTHFADRTKYCPECGAFMVNAQGEKK